MVYFGNVLNCPLGPAFIRSITVPIIIIVIIILTIEISTMKRRYMNKEISRVNTSDIHDSGWRIPENKIYYKKINDNYVNNYYCCIIIIIIIVPMYRY